jgi:hypothetical protein
MGFPASFEFASSTYALFPPPLCFCSGFSPTSGRFRLSFVLSTGVSGATEQLLLMPKELFFCVREKERECV